MNGQAYLSEILVDFALKYYNSDLPDTVMEMLPKLLVDKIGLILAGSQFPWSEGTYRAITAFPAKGESTVFYFGDKLSPEQAAFINASSGNAQDFDDTNIPSKIHAGGIMTPTALAVGESSGKSPQEIAKALLLGIEVMTRIGYAIPGSHLRGFHTPCVCGPFGAAITTGLLIGLTREQFISALAITGSFAGGVEEYTRTGGQIKRNLPAIAAIGGIKAAYLAKEGITGPPSILEGDHGICKTFDDGTHIDNIAKKLGEEWLVLDTSFKNYNCCYAIHAALEAFLLVCQANNIKPEDILEVAVGACTFVVDHVGTIKEPKVAVEAQFSLSFMLSLSLFNGIPGEYDVNDAVCKEQPLIDLSNKVRMHVDATAENEKADNMGAIVKVTTKEGSSFETRVRYPKGNTQNPMSVEDLENKFRKNLAPIISGDKINALLELIKDFGNSRNLNTFTKAMTKDYLLK